MIPERGAQAPDARFVRRTLAALDRAYGDEHWHWMPDAVQSPFDVIAGAILVQHTTWQAAERALESLRAAGMLDVRTLASLPDERIAEQVRMAGTPAVKARRLRAIASMIGGAGGLDAFLALPLAEMRPRLLATHGVGRETADAIALYAAGQRVFVIDAYTMRLFERLGVRPGGRPGGRGYEDWRAWFEEALPDADVRAFQRYHATIVLHGKAVCRARPLCGACPLRRVCAHATMQGAAHDVAAVHGNRMHAGQAD